MPVLPSSSSHDLVLTGIPRSGTSLLCHLLHRFSNCVVINEPESVSEAFDHARALHSVPQLYRDLRSAILAGCSIRNKFRHGQVVQDTTLEHRIAEYSPTVDGPDFVLGTKDTLAYLTSIRLLRAAMPEARFVACVRDPFQTIASWKASFIHLREALLPEVLSRQSIALGLRDDEHRALRQIGCITDLPERRARWWTYLAERILEERDRGLLLVRYHDLLDDPSRTLGHIIRQWPAGRLREPLLRQTPKVHPPRLDAADYEAIGDLCSGAAAALDLPLALAAAR